MTAYALRERAGKAGGGKGALIQTEKTGTVGTANDQVIIEIMNEKETIALAGNTIGRKPTNGGNGNGFETDGKMYTLTATDIHDMTHACDVIRESGDKTPTLKARMGTGGNNVPLVIDGGKENGNAEKADTDKVLPILRKETGKEASTLRRFGVPLSLQQTEILRPEMHGESLRVKREEKESLLDDGALSRKEGLSTRTVRDLRNDNEADGSASQEWRLAGQQTRESDASLQGMPQQNSSRPFCVRRLTPVEAERLQGFPDGYTKISYRGKSADECPDSPRYKAIGNSWAVPVVRWIGERIEKHLKGEIK